MLRFTYTAKIFSREHLDAPQQPVETARGTIEAESYAAAKEKAGSLIRERCNEHELKTGLLVGFEQLTLEIDDTPTETSMRALAAALLKPVENDEVTISTFKQQYQQVHTTYLAYQIALDILEGRISKEVLEEHSTSANVMKRA